MLPNAGTDYCHNEFICAGESTSVRPARRVTAAIPVNANAKVSAKNMTVIKEGPLLLDSWVGPLDERERQQVWDFRYR